MTSPELANRGLTIAECIPNNLDFLDEYQENAYQQILWDETGGTIKGKRPRQYMLDGLLEEIGEITEEDKTEPSYSRVGALILANNNEIIAPNPKLEPGNVSQTALERHLKEFGDVSWYLANFLRLYSLQFSRTVPIGVAAWELDRLSSPRADEEFYLLFERQLPWAQLSGASGELSAAAKAIMPIRRDERIAYEQRLLIAAGKMVTSMIHNAQTRFGIDYATILTANKDKLEKRIKDGTVFDKSGGDDR